MKAKNQNVLNWSNSITNSKQMAERKITPHSNMGTKINLNKSQ